MQKLFIPSTNISPEIYLSPAENIFHIKGNSMPEDVRAIYYPVIDWIKIFVNDLQCDSSAYTVINPLVIKIDLVYFNSSSAKFLFDIFSELKKLRKCGIPFRVEWYYDSDDHEMKDAGMDISSLSETEFTFIEKFEG